MRDPERIEEILFLIKSIWVQYPDLRLMQLLCNAITFPEDTFYTEDDDLVEMLKLHAKKLKEDNNEYNQSTVQNP